MEIKTSTVITLTMTPQEAMKLGHNLYINNSDELEYAGQELQSAADEAGAESIK